jgi:hypothetical protein
VRRRAPRHARPGPRAAQGPPSCRHLARRPCARGAVTLQEFPRTTDRPRIHVTHLLAHPWVLRRVRQPPRVDPQQRLRGALRPTSPTLPLLLLRRASIPSGGRGPSGGGGGAAWGVLAGVGAFKVETRV